MLHISLQLFYQGDGWFQARLVAQVMSDFRFQAMRSHVEVAISAGRGALALHLNLLAIHFTASASTSCSPFQCHRIASDGQDSIIIFMRIIFMCLLRDSGTQASRPISRPAIGKNRQQP